MNDSAVSSTLGSDTIQRIQTFRTWVDSCKPGRMVFFGGAGVSTESGIPDFRSADGLYSQDYGSYRPEEIISHSFFLRHPQLFYDYYCAHLIAPDAKPNQAHKKLAQLEAAGILQAVVTQNIDGLHQAAGSKNVLELHGGVLRNYCMRCGKAYSLDEMLAARAAAEDGVPRCDAHAHGGDSPCGGIIKPDVVLYEEGLDGDIMEAAVRAIRTSDLMVIAGTSLAVSPACYLVDYFGGDHLVIVNRSATPRDRDADLCINANVGEVFNW